MRQVTDQNKRKIESVVHLLALILCGPLFSGLLERPAVPSNIEEVCYKLFFVGKSGAGKSAAIARLAGTTFMATHVESYGIRKTNIFWPVKIWNKIILFELHCWESSDSSLKKCGHILPVSVLFNLVCSTHFEKPSFLLDHHFFKVFLNRIAKFARSHAQVRT